MIKISSLVLFIVSFLATSVVKAETGTIEISPEIDALAHGACMQIAEDGLQAQYPTVSAIEESGSLVIIECSNYDLSSSSNSVWNKISRVAESLFGIPEARAELFRRRGSRPSDAGQPSTGGGRPHDSYQSGHGRYHDGRTSAYYPGAPRNTTATGDNGIITNTNPGNNRFGGGIFGPR